MSSLPESKASKSSASSGSSSPDLTPPAKVAKLEVSSSESTPPSSLSRDEELSDYKSVDEGDLHCLNEAMGMETLKRPEGDDDVSDSSDDSERALTEEEMAQYLAAVKASDGFDVPSFPDADAPIRCLCLNVHKREYLRRYCVAAMDHYNNKHNTNFEFVILEKANAYSDCPPIIFYLTFVGRTPENETKTFQARVNNRTTKVMLCREKGSTKAEDNYTSDDVDDVSDSPDDSERPLTEEEFEQYIAALEASDGFDVPSFADADAPIRCLCLDDDKREYLRPYCVAAMDHHNKEHNTNFEFLILEKANAYSEFPPIIFYLTFVGSTPENETKTFQAEVIDRTTKVMLCREKAPPTKAEV